MAWPGLVGTGTVIEMYTAALSKNQLISAGLYERSGLARFFGHATLLPCLTFSRQDQDAAPVGLDHICRAALRPGRRPSIHCVEMLHKARSQVGKERPDVLDNPYYQASGQRCFRHSHDDRRPSRR